jgi:ferredoxin-NADP reductase
MTENINKVMLTKYMTTDELYNSIFYICGPPGMLKAMRKLLQEELEIPKERIKVEVDAYSRRIAMLSALVSSFVFVR